MVLDDLRALLGTLKSFTSHLPKGKGARVYGADPKAAAKAIVETYFRNIRPGVSPTFDTASCDREMQELLALANKQAAAERYKSVARTLKKELEAIEAAVVSAPATTPPIPTLDQRVLEAIRTLPLPGAALAYEQALKDLNGEERISWRGPATDLREALRETLDHLAPDAAVEAQPGFTHESRPPARPKPTMRQKARYVLRNRNATDPATQSVEDAVGVVEDTVGRFVRSVYSRSNVSTHTPTSREEVTSVREYVRTALCDLLGVR